MKKILLVLVIFISTMLVYGFVNDLLLYSYLSWTQSLEHEGDLIYMGMKTMAGLIVVCTYLLFKKNKENKM